MARNLTKKEKGGENMMCSVLIKILGNHSRHFPLNLMRAIKPCTEVCAQPCAMSKATLTVIRRSKRRGKGRIFTQENNFCYLLSCQSCNYLHRIMEEANGRCSHSETPGISVESLEEVE